MNVLKRLIPYLRPYRVSIIVTLLLGVALSSVGIMAAKLIKIVTDDIFVGKDLELLRVVPLYFVGLYVVAGVVRFIHLYILRYTGDQVAVDIRSDLQDKYSKLGLEILGRYNTGALISRTMNDVNMMQLGLTLAADIIKEPFAIVALVGYLLYANWRLTLAVAIVVPILVLISKSLGRSVRKYSHEMQRSNEEFTSVTKETLDGIRIVKAFKLESRLLQRFKDVGSRFLFTRRQIISREEAVGPVFEFLASVVVAGLVLYMGWEIIKGRATTGDFISFVGVLGMLQNPIKKLQDAHVRLQHTITACQRVFEVLDMPETVLEPEQAGLKPVSWPQPWKKLQFENVSFSYGDRVILDGVNFEVSRGEIVALVGPSGAGKTTLVNLLLRFFDVTGGAIKADDIDLRCFPLSDLRSQFAMVNQDVFLFNESVRDNVSSGQASTDESIKRALQVANALAVVDGLPHGLDSLVGDRGTKLSGGERQRISIARAVFKNAPILILDEATSSLDSKSEREVQEALDHLVEGRTTFVIAHRLSTIQKADRILVLDQGKIVEQGTHDELIKKNGLYQHLHSIQFSV
ncbi:MAG: ATP-binding cassette domain-containing protein [Oligoflexia bacterium]|nr:ATP-binding cassette domain-containing protein [Oligoflexia bacterium]